MAQNTAQQNPIQITVRPHRRDTNKDPITVTLSRPLAGNQVLIIANEGASLIPIQDRDNEGALKGRNPNNQDYEVLVFVYLNYKENKIYIQHDFRLDPPPHMDV